MDSEIQNLIDDLGVAIPTQGLRSIDEVFNRVNSRINAQEKAIMFSNKTLAQTSTEQHKPLYAASSYTSFLLETYFHEKLLAGISTFRFVDKSIWVRRNNIKELLDALYEKYKLIFVYYYNEVVASNENSFIRFSTANDDLDKVDIFSTNPESAKELENFIDSYQCKEKKVSVSWIYSPDGRSVDLIETFEEEVDQTLYPFVKDFDTFNERFMASKSNILLLVGEPGTGKTTFIKNLLASMDKLSYLTYDEKILNNDYTFAKYMEDEEAGAFVIEDADLFLRSRADGNGMVSRFLNVGDGLIKLPNKKLIFSTNLPNISEIDSALIRPGRCFDIIHFRKLTRVEAQVVADKRGLILPGNDKKDSYTLAEIFNNAVKKPEKVARTFGFY